jgi:signal transduction histidine kinase
VAVHSVGLELERLGGPEHEAAIRDYLHRRYGTERLDAVVVLGDPAVRCVLDWQATLWPGVPVVAALVDPVLARRVDEHPEMTGFTVRIDIDGTLDAALALLPETKRLAWVAGADDYRGVVDRVLAERRDRLDVIELVDLPIAETEDRLASLPPDTIVLYTAINRDGAGQAFTSVRALERLAPVTNRPIFSYPGTYLGHGIVGGSIVDLEAVGREAAHLALRVLSGESPAAMPVFEADLTRLLFDGRQMDRWGLSDSRLPAGSRVLFRKRTMWDDHKGTLLAALGGLGVQSVLIVALFVAMRRRRRAENQLRRLSGRMLSAQEGERRRIAQELHDDVSQRLALFAIELDELSSRSSGSDSGSRGQAGALSAKARSLSTDVHHIAYELHPAILDQLGLVPALRQFADQIATRHGIAVEVTEADWPRELPRDVSIALYRTVQEALQNVVKHSGAGEARVALRGSRKGVTLMVSDSGCGFDPEAAGVRMRLGLAGMRERLRLVRGELCIDSSPSDGTVVAAGIPVEALVPPPTVEPPEDDEITTDVETPHPAR